MAADGLVDSLTAALAAIPIIDSHSHIDPLSPVSKSLDDILGYHYYTELAHSAGMPKDVLAPSTSPKERCREIVKYLGRCDNTMQVEWFLTIAREFLGNPATRIADIEADHLFDVAASKFKQHDWAKQVFAATKLEKIILTNEFDDPLEGFDTSVYVPCLRVDTLVMKLHEPETILRLAKFTGIEVGDAATLRAALRKLFERFCNKQAKACAVSLPSWFAPTPVMDPLLTKVVRDKSTQYVPTYGPHVFWVIVELCREFKLPFDLMIGVNRDVYQNGVHQGRDLFDSRTSLIQYRELFNAFPEVTFPVSVLTSGQNQELVAYSWIFPNVVCHGHWWYSNLPGYIGRDLCDRLQGVPKVKLLGYYSDAYKLEFVLPKYAMYRRVLANVLADEFVRPGRLSETEAVSLGQCLLRNNVRATFKV